MYKNVILLAICVFLFHFTSTSKMPKVPPC